MRRGLASLIMGLSLLVATASWAGFIMSRTVLDPGRSERLADTLLDNTDVRAAIVDRLADSVETQIPAEVPVTRETIEDAADTALDDPRVEALLRDGLVQVHQNALNGVDEPVTLDAAALGAAGRDAVVDLRPELDPVLPAAPSLEVELPSAGLSWLGTVKRYVDRFTLIGAVVALIGVTTAFVLARNRAAALRRIAFWAFGASAFWLAVAYGLPWILGRIAPSSVSIATAAIDVFFGAMIRPALTLAGVGLALLLASFAWPALERRRPAAMLDRPTGPATVDRAAHPMAAAPSSMAAQPGMLPSRPVPPQPPTGVTTAPPYPAAHHYPPAGDDQTRPFPDIISNAGTVPPAAPPTEAAIPTRRQRRSDDLLPPLPADAPPTQLHAQVASSEAEPSAPLFDIDPERAADVDDFGADWVEGVGYVEEEPRRP